VLPGDFGYLAVCDGCCDDADDFQIWKIPNWRYSAVNRKNFFAALSCALLVFSMLGCGSSNHLQSVQLSAVQQNGQPITTQGGIYNLSGDGSTLQLAAYGVYSNGKSVLLNGDGVTYTMIVDPNYTEDAYGVTLLPPCIGPCTDSAHGTAEISPTGLVTAVEPATCTWVDVSPGTSAPSWFFEGAYQVTATYHGITSQPAYIPIASRAGNPNDIFPPTPQTDNNPQRLCGPDSPQ
jgi:hypothetical protein